MEFTKDLSRLFPSIRDSKSLAIFPDHAVPNRALARLSGQPRIFFDAHCLKPFGHFHCITVGTARGDDRAPCDGIPSGVSPLNLSFSHLVLPTIAWPAAASDRSAYRIDDLKSDEVLFVVRHHNTFVRPSDCGDDHVEPASRLAGRFAFSHQARPDQPRPVVE